MNVHEVKSIETKSILSRLKSKDNYWGIAYNMNLYRGCQHGCIYCDTRSSCYGVGDISHISVKKNALELLDHELGTKRGKSIRDITQKINYRLARTNLGVSLSTFTIHQVIKKGKNEI
jgi:DNA repair photolyase